MTPTSDERREVAERLRDEADGFRRLENELGQLTIDLGEVTAVFQDVAHFAGFDGTVRTCVLLDRIADLMDPTCNVVRKQVYAGGPQMYKTLWCCSECGFPLAESKYKGHRPFVEENFCPRCGARVVEGGEG